MKHTRFKVLIAIGIMMAFSIKASYSQESHKTDSCGFSKFLPDYVKLQYAGGIGFLSAGIGYTFADHKIDVSLFYGYVPTWFTVDDLHSISLQFTAKLIRIKVSEKVEIIPLNIGFYFHHTFGNEYWVRLPDYYPRKYYWWSPGRNTGLFLGWEIKTKLLANKTPASGIAFYTRVGTRGLYVASKFSNSSIPMSDIIELGFGIAIYR
ncbi:MAG: hypothetical protein L3J31_03205 [Bacteroidales bacterium]|nr:hypothetical protein [Bacteroidales bacterium]